jgi:hypothetical protein
MATARKTTVKFKEVRQTKNTVRFDEVVADGDPTAIGSLYVQKFTLKELGNPETLTVTLEAG